MRKERYFFNATTNEISKNFWEVFHWIVRGDEVEKRITCVDPAVEVYNKRERKTENPFRRYFVNNLTNEITNDHDKAMAWWLGGATVEYRVIGQAHPYEVWEAL